MKTILINWLPPSLVNIASPAASVLKGFLQREGYEVHVKYWNLTFEPLLKDFFHLGNEIEKKDIYRFLPFLAYLAVHYKDTALTQRIKYYILSLKPHLNSKTVHYIDTYLLDSYERINRLIDTELRQMPIDDYLYIGFSTQFNQWIVANIIAERIHKLKPEAICMAGGCGTREEARALLRNSPHLRYVSWGEGEYSLLQLTRFLDPSFAATMSIEEIPHIAYRKEENIRSSEKANVYVDLDENRYDYTDYFEQLAKYALHIKPRFPIEKGRGCHWRQCRFCFLNAGYKFRVKRPETILKEMEMALKEYPIQQFFFLDNDIIANDRMEFDRFLDELIDFRSTHRPFQIVMAEVITKNITSSLIEKMVVAGFKKIQIGYESPSANLLVKINKKNTFASNLLCIKWGLHYGIKLGGVNVLRNLPEETEEDIKEGIRNLYYLRFFLSKDAFYHSMSYLAVATSSRYFKCLKPEEIDRYESVLWRLLPTGYMREEDKYTLLMDFVNPDHNRLWDVFTATEAHYLQNTYTYKLMYANGLIYYREFYNSEDTKELEFDGACSLYWRVLEECNHVVRSLEELQRLMEKEGTLSKESLADVVDSLKEEGIVYCNDDKSQIVSIINTDLLAGNAKGNDREYFLEAGPDRLVVNT